jgi:hypothetical protein
MTKTTEELEGEVRALRVMLETALTDFPPNHIHANSLDILSPLRIAQLRFDKGREMRTVLPDNPQHKVGLLLTADDIDDITEFLAGVKLHADWDAPTLPPLDERHIFLLGVCLDEAIATAYDDRMPLTAKPMEQLVHEVRSGRRPLRIVMGRCHTCWPEGN